MTVHWSAARNEERLLSRWVYMGFRLFVLGRSRSGQLSSMLGGTGDGCVLGGPICRRPTLPGPAPPRPAAVRRPAVRRPAVRRPDPTRSWYVRVLGSTYMTGHQQLFDYDVDHRAPRPKGFMLYIATVEVYTLMVKVQHVTAQCQITLPSIG